MAMRRHYARNTGYSNGRADFSILAYSWLFWNEPYISKGFENDLSGVLRYRVVKIHSGLFRVIFEEILISLGFFGSTLFVVIFV